jgi:hypothetical protein
MSARSRADYLKAGADAATATLASGTHPDGSAFSLATSNAAIGATTDAAVTSDTPGTLAGYLRGLIKWAFERMPTSLGQKTRANSLPVVIASDQQSFGVDVLTHPALIAGTSRVGGVYQVGGQIIDESGVVLTVKRAFVNLAASTSNGSIVAAVATKKLRVLALFMLCGATATDITFQSNATAISPLFANAANGGAALAQTPFGWFETTAGEALKATTGAGSATGVLVLYVEV